MKSLACIERKTRRREPAGDVFSGLIAHDRKCWLDRYQHVTLEEHRPRLLDALRKVKELKSNKAWSADGI
jgi:hypothetical protein